MRALLRRADGSLAVVIPAAGVDALAEAQRLAALPEYAGLEVVGVVDPEALPSSRRWRQAWRAVFVEQDLDSEGKAQPPRLTVAPDVGEVRGLRLAEIRAQRDAELAASDAAALAATDRGDQGEIARLRTYRQALRDLPATVQTQLAGVDTIAGLEAYAPAWPTPPTAQLAAAAARIRP